jgi:ubiquinone/menaquinone biosynthesis C-methylase UbiE
MTDDEVHAALEQLGRIRDTVLANAQLRAGERVVDVGAGNGLLTVGALERVGADGTVFAVDPSVAALEELRSHATRGGVYYLIGEAAVLPLPNASVDAAVARSVFIYVDELPAAAEELARVLRPAGRLSIFEPLNRHSTYIYNTVEWPNDLRAKVVREGDAYMRRSSGLVSFDEDAFQELLPAAGFDAIEADIREEWEEWAVTPMSADARLDAVPAPNEPSLRERWQQAFGADEVARLVSHLKGLAGTTLKFRRVSMFLSAVKP